MRQSPTNQKAANTLLWEGNICTVNRKSDGNEPTVPEIPCYWIGQSGPPPVLTVRYRFDPATFAWDPEKNRQQ